MYGQLLHSLEMFACGEIVVLNEDVHVGGVGLVRLPVPVALLVYRDRVVLIDTGLSPLSVDGGPFSPYAFLDGRVSTVHSAENSLVTQLGRRGFVPRDVTDVIITHNHFEHTGGMALFPQATLHIGAADWATAQSSTGPFAAMYTPLKMAQSSPRIEYERDRDLFDDGVVTVLALPGHTVGTLGVLVTLSGQSVAITGDVAESESAFLAEAAGPNDVDPKQASQSIRRLKEVADKVSATVWISHQTATWNRWRTGSSPS
ncbi:N-acyl homoserine lactonase family protein [Glaciihabitans sp. UYNi722]|uniref:N-acyl homoserine lactonase family protein n=1 Tax=Glaciihabitans sp. UYNi722 TaxID=3156344 RepID=UPI0033945789